MNTRMQTQPTLNRPQTMNSRFTDSAQRDIVLVVDDSPDTLNMITDALASAGVTVLVALDGRRALSLLEQVTPDIILMDAIMPGLDGFETCERLKQMDGLAHTPVIFMTGLSETEHIVHGMEAGGVDYVTKPVSPDELLARMRVHLANARLASSARAALDATGRYMLAINAAGDVLWRTPQAAQLLADCITHRRLQDPAANVTVARLLASCLGQRDGVKVDLDDPDSAVQACLIGQVGADEYLLNLSNNRKPPSERVLAEALGLTTRQAEVLLWVSNGKSNREIAVILGMSPRTVNKHLEMVYEKIGVENRTSAAIIGLNTLAHHVS